VRPKANVQQQESSGGRFNIVWAVIFTIAAVGVWVFLNRSNIQEYMETQRKRDAARESIATIKSRISLLKRQQQSLEFNGMEGEKQIRERLQMHKQGEKVMFFMEDGEAVTTAPPTLPGEAVSTGSNAAGTKK
jgi:hypothetical protein